MKTATDEKCMKANLVRHVEDRLSLGTGPVGYSGRMKVNPAHSEQAFFFFLSESNFPRMCRTSEAGSIAVTAGPSKLL